ncbi:MAG: aldo/keto reductase, partial [Treponema sp.]|nr:aldo/keto reductase [Treponema sp.]
MDYLGLGKSNLLASRVGFGAMSLKDIDGEDNAAILIHKAYDAGVNFFDISHTVPESEKRLGACLHGIRQNVILSTKACVLDARSLAEDLEASLDALQTDYVDLFLYEVDEKGLADFDQVVAQMKRLQ